MVQEQVGLESDIVDLCDKGNFEVRSEFLLQLSYAYEVYAIAGGNQHWLALEQL